MFDFIKENMNRKALKKALLEIEIEEQLKKQSLVQNQVLREHKTDQEAVPFSKPKIKNSLSKPQTEAVDLKNFKNWRSVSVVNKPEPDKIRPKFKFDDDDDEGDQPEIESPVSTLKNNLLSKISGLSDNSNKGEEEKKDTSIASFFREKYKVEPKIEPKEEPTTSIQPDIKVEEKPELKHVKVSLNDLLKKKLEQEPINSIVPEANEVKKETNANDDKKENTLKVEIVDLTEKKEIKEPQKEKKTVNRKPRGKNKRKFDADVISSVDWK